MSTDLNDTMYVLYHTRDWDPSDVGKAEEKLQAFLAHCVEMEKRGPGSDALWHMSDFADLVLQFHLDQFAAPTPGRGIALKLRHLHSALSTAAVYYELAEKQERGACVLQASAPLLGLFAKAKGAFASLRRHCLGMKMVGLVGFFQRS